jgi:carbamoyltransferase
LILGISAYYHDSAAAIVGEDGILAAAQEERFTRIKHDSSFPIHAVKYCLEEGNLKLEDLDQVVFYEKPFLKFDRLLETYVGFAPVGLHSFVKAMPQWLKHKLHLPREIRKQLPGKWDKSIVFTTHHESHAASAFFPSPFEKAAILTMDGVGEWDSATIGVGKGNNIELLKSMHFPDSLGLLYSAFTYFCGFKVNSGEYKLMGLAPYGSPVYKDKIVDELLDLKGDGSFRVNLDYFNYCQGLTMTNKQFDQLFGGPPRSSESQITQREIDLAASIQAVTEEIVLRMAKYAKEVSGLNNLCLAGGVALNCVANGKLLQSKIFDQIWIQPASGDAGGALGAALFTHYQLMDKHRKTKTSDLMKGSFLGPCFTNDEIRDFLTDSDTPHHFYKNEDDLLEIVSQQLDAGKIIGWFQGRMEFGPRALGSRSIIGDARNSEMQTKMNLSIKFRESFRPFAPSVLEEEVGRYFDLDSTSPYMLLVAPVAKNIRKAPSKDETEKMQDPDLLKRVKIERSTLPAITHVDYSARVQSICEDRNGRYYRLVKKFNESTKSPVLVNTSFNIRGEPIVCTPKDAYRCFVSTDMDILILENFVLFKEEQPKSTLLTKEEYLASFELD